MPVPKEATNASQKKPPRREKQPIAPARKHTERAKPHPYLLIHLMVRNRYAPGPYKASLKTPPPPLSPPLSSHRQPKARCGARSRVFTFSHLTARGFDCRK